MKIKTMKKLLEIMLFLQVFGLSTTVNAQTDNLSACVAEAMASDPDIAIYQLTNASLAATESTADAAYHLLFMHTDEDPGTKIEVVIKQKQSCSVADIDPGGDGLDYFQVLPESVAASFSEASKSFWAKQVTSQ